MPVRRGVDGDVAPLGLHVVLAGIRSSCWITGGARPSPLTCRASTSRCGVNTLPRLKRDEPWYEIGVDDPNRCRRRCPEPADR